MKFPTTSHSSDWLNPWDTDLIWHVLLLQKNFPSRFCLCSRNKALEDQKTWQQARATPTATPVPTPTPNPAVKYPDAPTSFDDLIANYAGISYAAWNKSNAVITSSNDVALPFKSITGVNTTLSFKNPATAFQLLQKRETPQSWKIVHYFCA